MRQSRTGEQCAVRITRRQPCALRIGTKRAVIIVAVSATVAVKSSLVIAELLLGLSPLHDVIYGESHLD
jgi:hypothetical protein